MSSKDMFFILVPRDAVTHEMLSTALSSLLDINYAQPIQHIAVYESNLRKTFDTTDEIEYTIFKVRYSFLSAFAGYRKSTYDEFIIILDAPTWEHNQITE